MYLEQSKNS
uniref:Uncharacterized protein n=1 Tax=Rhizophora mucronata TaxID=61149 RepID=A0A2P2Q187_RHIMU